MSWADASTLGILLSDIQVNEAPMIKGSHKAGLGGTYVPIKF